MHEESPVRQQDIARALGISIATVSMALRNSPLVRETTRQEVLEQAEAMGYRRSPYVSALMAQVRRGSSLSLGTIAVADCWEESGWKRARSFARMWEGIQRCADKLGFQLDLFRIAGEPKGERLSPQKFLQVLRARGIRGVLLLPVPKQFRWPRLDWSGLSVVAVGVSISEPRFDRVTQDHGAMIRLAFEMLRTSGRERPALLINKEQDDRLFRGWSSAFLGLGSPPGSNSKRLVRVDEFTVRNLHRTLQVLRKAKADSLITSEWLLRQVIEVDAGFYESLECVLIDRQRGAVKEACVVQQNDVVGEMAINTLAAHINRNRTGLPETPVTVVVAPRWQDATR